MSAVKGPGLYELLTEAELQQYFNTLKNELKVQNVGQLKFVLDEDFQGIGMSKPEIRRLKKYFHKYCPNTYLSKFKKILMTKKDDQDNIGVLIPEDNGDRNTVRVPSKHIIPADAIVINKELGVGEFGVVQQGVWTNEDGERIQVAIKCLTKERMQTQPMDFLKEAAIMHNINAEHIVRLYGVVLDTNALMLVTELAPLRSLLECIKEPSLRQSFPVPSLCNFSVQICDGMTYLESNRLIHRDLAARNVLVFSKNKVKISDFGLSRSLGVGKDYYQTNFNVNLKLPIAWCAPECINYLKFTSASDVWAFGVTLWEMFSYGFQPWAALTGQLILEQIDEPNFQRLEQPEACPKEYYAIMQKCWQHDPSKRPKFCELLYILPECMPEQVQSIKASEEVMNNSIKRDRLQYNNGDIITVLDKRPISGDGVILWKGALNSGKTGLFVPANTVAYLGNVPSNKSTFQRGDGKNPYSSRRRLRPDMISRPQGDFKHTLHVGLDGTHFGDVSFLNDKYDKLPKQIVTPYKPSDDHDQTSLTRASSDVSDRAPLLKKVGDKGKFGPASEHNWSDTASESQPDSPCHSANNSKDHEYHEISDEEEDHFIPKKHEGFRSSSFDLGPSLMDEVFKALNSSNDDVETQGNSLPPLLPSQVTPSSPATVEDNEAHNVRNEIKEMAFKFSAKDNGKKKRAMVKPISASDQKTLESAIAMANELASKSMLELDNNLMEGYTEDLDRLTPETPNTPTSPSKSTGSLFSFKFNSRGSPKGSRRNFSEEVASIPDIQSSITDEARKLYNSMVEKQEDVEPKKRVPCDTEPTDHNPLRMLRAGIPVRPKVRGNKHNINSGFSTIERSTKSNIRDSLKLSSTDTHNNFDIGSHQTLPRGFKHNKVPPPVKPKPSLLVLQNAQRNLDEFNENENPDHNPLPLPPRDRSKSLTTAKPRHQRKHPLIKPGGVAHSLLKSGGHLPTVTDKVESPSRLVIQHTHNPQLETHNNGMDGETNARVPPAKPPRLFTPGSLDDSFDTQVANEMEALELMNHESHGLSPPPFPYDDGAPPHFPLSEIPLPPSPDECDGSLYQSNDHVSCEDLLDFALDRPNCRRTQGPAHGTQSDEVHLMLKVLKQEVSAQECVQSLDECEWNVHKALKLLRLQLQVPNQCVSLRTAKLTLASFSWDISKTATYLTAASNVAEDTAQV